MLLRQVRQLLQPNQMKRRLLKRLLRQLRLPHHQLLLKRLLRLLLERHRLR